MQQDRYAGNATIHELVGDHKAFHGQYRHACTGRNLQKAFEITDLFPFDLIDKVFSGHEAVLDCIANIGFFVMTGLKNQNHLLAQ